MGRESNKENGMSGISARCVTFQRKNLLEQALYCYLQQDYRGPKELLILNDDPDIEFIFEHPEVRIINNPYRYDSVYNKINDAVKFCKYEYVMPWPDDDLFAPWAISTALKYAKRSDKPYVELAPYWKGSEKRETFDGKKYLFNAAYLPGIHVVTREYWINSGGHPQEAIDNQGNRITGNKSDVFMNRNAKKSGNYSQARLKLNEIYYLWRASKGQSWGRENWKRSPQEKYIPNPKRIPQKVELKPQKVVCSFLGLT